MSKLDFAILSVALAALIYTVFVVAPKEIADDEWKTNVCKSNGFDSAIYYDYSVSTKTLDGQVFIECIKNRSTAWVPLNDTGEKR